MALRLSTSLNLGARIPSFLGKHHTTETKKKIGEARRGKHYPKASEAQKGKKHSEEHNRKISEKTRGEKNPFYGKHHSEKTKMKISQAQKNSNRNLKGQANPAWRGGVTPITVQIKNSNIYQEWRQQVFIRDDFTCQKCGIKGGSLNAHHKKSFSILLKEVKNCLPLLSLYDGAMTYSPLWELHNGVTLCKKCHYGLHKLKKLTIKKEV